MKGNCDLIKCQICQQEMSFGRIKRHIKVQHKDINVDQYVKMYWSTLPLHHPCEVCNKNIVYKYKTCSKECRHQLEHGHKGKPKPEGFITDKHKEILRKILIGKPGRFTNHKHTEITKKIQSETIKRTKPHLVAINILKKQNKFNLKKEKNTTLKEMNLGLKQTHILLKL
jgi:predicted nucleic acid-binding Zn ribbon protein